jgi:multidrug resistance efflux pump
MMAGILVITVACVVFWLVFLKFKLLRLTPGWVVGFSIVVLHLFVIFLIGLRYVTPQSASATVVQHTIQLIPRLSEPTLVTEVLVEDNTQVKKGQPLFQFDRTIYAAKVAQLEAQVDRANTSVADIGAQLQQAQYYLDNTTMVAPEDGRIINLQVRPGMVSGILRIGGIAALICDADRYVLATYFQENLKYVRPGQFAELAFNLYPGQIFKGHVDSIWKANGVGQYLPSDEIPRYEPLNPNIPQGQYAVKILIDDPDQSKFPIGAQGAAAIYTEGDQGAWAALRKIAIRARTWLAWLYPL